MNKLIKVILVTILIFPNTLTFASDDIKWLRGWEGIFREFMYYQVFIVLLLILLYFYNARINNKNQKITLSEECRIKNYNVKYEFLIKNLKKLLKSAESLNKSEFYEKLNKFFREYFDLLWISNTDTMTLKEIKNLDLDKDLILLFEESYFNEFNDKKDTITWRKNLISKFIKFIK